MPTGCRSTTTSRPPPTSTRKAIPATAIRRTSSSSPTPIRPSPAQAADLVLPTAMWVEKEGAYGNAERRTQFWHQLVNAPGEARSDLWQLMEFSKRFKIEEVWPAELIAKKPDVSRQDAVRRAVQERRGRQISAVGDGRGLREPRVQGVRLLRAEGTVRGIRRVRPRPRPRSCAVRRLSRGARPALAGRQGQGDALALPRGPTIPTSRQARAWSSTASPTARRASSPCPTSRRRNPPTTPIPTGW